MTGNIRHVETDVPVIDAMETSPATEGDLPVIEDPAPAGEDAAEEQPGSGF